MRTQLVAFLVVSCFFATVGEKISNIRNKAVLQDQFVAEHFESYRDPYSDDWKKRASSLDWLARKWIHQNACLPIDVVSIDQRTTGSESILNLLPLITGVRRIAWAGDCLSLKSARDIARIDYLEDLDIECSKCDEGALSVLSQARSLRRLTLKISPSFDINGIERLKQLKTLRVEGKFSCSLADRIRVMNNLEQLRIRHLPSTICIQTDCNSRNQFDFVADLVNLHDLQIDVSDSLRQSEDFAFGCSFAEAVNSLPALHRLSIEGPVDVACISSIKSKSIVELTIVSNALSDENLSVFNKLGALKQIRKLSIHGNLTHASVMKLKTTFPQATVNGF